MQTQSFLQCAMIASLSLYSPAQSSVERAPALQDSTPLAVDPSSRVPQAEHFTDIQGVRESTGTLIVRLIRADQAAAYGLAPEQVEARRQAGKQIVAAYELLRATPETEEYVIRVPAEETDYSLAVKLMETGAFEYAEPNWTVYPVGTPNDSLYANQWHHSRIQSSGAWDINKGSREISCSILDTGVRTTHADLTARREGFNVSMNSWESGGGQISDLNGHGTMTAGVAAAKGNNNLGVSGVGWNLSFRPVRVSEQSNGSSTIDLLTAAVRTAADAGDKIISVSYSGVANAAVESAGAYARSRGALLIWAAGNSAENHQGDRNDNVFIVGATDSNDTLTSWSGRGPRLDMVAPGVDIFTTSNIGDNHYAASSGTSFSTPMVAGLAGLIWSRNPALTPAQVENILRTSADDLGAAGVDDMYGYGRMNSAAAIAMTPRASRTPYWATSVPETSSPASDVPWKNESFAGGPESCDSCNTTTCEYASNSSDLDVTPLVATDFECFTLPDNHFISKVEVEVSAVYNSGTSANLEIRAVLPSHYLDTGWRTTPTFVSGTRCAPRAGATGDITNLCNNWTADMVNNIQLQVRRPSGLSCNTLRIVSMKVMVTIQRI